MLMNFYLCVQIQSTCAVLALSFPHEPAWSPPAAVPALGAPKDQGSFRGINDRKLCDFLAWMVPQPPEHFSLGSPLPVVLRSLAVTPSGITQSKSCSYNFFIFFFVHSQFNKISKSPATEKASSLRPCSVKGGASFSSMPVQVVLGAGMQMVLQLPVKGGWGLS